MRRPLEAVRLVCLALATMLAAVPVRAQKNDDVQHLFQQFSQLYQAGKYAEAEPLAKRMVEIARQRFGESSQGYARSLNGLALLYKAQGRYADAEPRYKRSLAIRENALGPEHLEVAASLNNLAALYYAQGRYCVPRVHSFRAVGGLT